MATDTVGCQRIPWPLYRKMREFRSLEADIGPLCLSNGSGEYFSDENLLSRPEVSASLPNLANDMLFMTGGFTGLKSHRKSCISFCNESFLYPPRTSLDASAEERFLYEYELKANVKVNQNANAKDQEASFQYRKTTEMKTPIKCEEQHGQIVPNFGEEGCRIYPSSHEQLNTQFSMKSEPAVATEPAEEKLSLEGSARDPALENETRSETDTTSEDVDLEKTDELTLLKESPRGSPGNTLDSGVCSLGRTDSFGRTDASSFSSVSSISVECSGAVESEILEEDCDVNNVTLAGDSPEHCSACKKSETAVSRREREVDVSVGTKPKRTPLSLSNFLSRSLFSRKNKEEAGGNQTGWRLFGRATAVKPDSGSEPASAGMRSNTSVTSLEGLDTDGGRKVKKTDIEVLSTTALILEQRPSGLPCKDPEEELRHKQQYEQMIEAAKRKEMKEAKQRKKQLQQQLKHEDEMAAAVKIWNTELLTNWEHMHNSKKARDLWWHGIPPSVRGRVWKLAFGNDLNLTKDLYHICLNRAKERLKLIEDWCGDTDSICSYMSGFSDHSASREASVELIKLDVSRTFPQLCIFQKGGPYHELLQGLLGAYACYRPDVGYVQGMSFIAAVLLLNMEVQDAFICFANLLNRPCQIAFFRLDEYLMRAYFDTYEEFFEENLPELYVHFKKLNITSDLYIIDWMFTLYAKSLPLDIASRVWDIFARDGEEFLFRTALGILKLYEDILINMDFIHLAQFLTKLPEHIQSDQLFACLERVRMQVDTRTFKHVLAANRDAIKEPSSYS